MYAQTLHSPPPSSTSASTIVSVHSSNDFLTSPTQSAGDMKSPRSPLSPVSPPGGGHYGTSHKIPAATPSSDSMSFPSPPSEAFHSNVTTPCEEPKSRTPKTPTTPVEMFIAVNSGYLETNIDSPEYVTNKHAAHLASQETLDSHSIDTQSLDAHCLDAPSVDNFSEPGTEIVLLDEEMQYVDVRSNITSGASDADRPGDLPIRSGKDFKSPDVSPSDKDLEELNRILLSPAQNTTITTSTTETGSDTRVLPAEGASMTTRDQTSSQSNGAVTSPSEKDIVRAKSHDSSVVSHDQSNNAQNLTSTQAVLTKDERSHQASRSRSDDVDIKTPEKPSGLKTPEMSSSPMDVDSLSSSYDKMVDSSSPSDKAVAMTPDNISMDELSDHDPGKDHYSKVGQRSRHSKASTDSVGSSGDELGHGKMDISFHSDKDVLEEEPVFMETNSKSKSPSIDSLDKGPVAPKTPKLEGEESNPVKAKIKTANKELLKEPETVKSPESETLKEVKSRKSPSLSPNSTANTVSSANGIVSPASTESTKSAIDDLIETSIEKNADSSFVMRSATETETKSLPVPKRKRSVKDLLSQFETLTQSPPKDGQGHSPPQCAGMGEPNEASKSRPAVFQKPKIVHLKTLSPSAQQDASDFSQVQQQTFQTKAPMKTTPETSKKADTVVTSTPVSKPKEEKTTPPVKPRDTKDRPIPSEKAMTNGQSMMSKSLDQSMLLKSLDPSNTSELSVDTSSLDIMSRSVEMTPSELNKDKPAKPGKKLGHSPSFKERLRMYENQRENKAQTQAGGKQQGTSELNAGNRTERANSEESVGSVRNLSKMFERQNSNRSDGFSDRSRSVSREPEEPIKKPAAPVDAKVTKDAQVLSKDETQPNTQNDSDASKKTSPSKEKKSVRKLLGMFEQQNPSEPEGGSSSSEERGGRGGGGKKPWTAIV